MDNTKELILDVSSLIFLHTWLKREVRLGETGDTSSAFEPFRKTMTPSKCFLSHDGSLAMSQRREWGRDHVRQGYAYAKNKAGDTVRVGSSRIYPVLAEGLSVHHGTTINLSSLTVGDYRTNPGEKRVPIMKILERLFLDVIYRDQIRARGMLENVWRERIDVIDTEEIPGVILHWYEDWAERMTDLVVTPQVMSEREALEAWGSW